MKNSHSLFDDILAIVELYLQHSYSVEPVDGLFISIDMKLSLIMEDDIYEIGDYYPMKELLMTEENEGQITVSPNETVIHQIADYYSDKK